MGFQSDVEVVIKGDFSHIADVVFSNNYIGEKISGYKGYAVEYQCASITIDEYRERNETYLNMNLKPIWIFGVRYMKFERIKKIIKLNLEDQGFSLFCRNYKITCFTGDKRYNISFQKFIELISGLTSIYDQIEQLQTEVKYNKDLVKVYNKEINDKEKIMARYLKKIKSFQPEKKELKTALRLAEESIDARDFRNTKLMKENAKLYDRIYELEQKIKSS